MIIFLFVDGMGIGPAGDQNPLSWNHFPGIEELCGGQKLVEGIQNLHSGDVLFKAIDANIDMPGLPQSGTGQATLFSGENASKLAGRHYGPFPHSATKHLLGEKSIFSHFKQQGKTATFINAFPQRFIDYCAAKNRWSCCMLMAREYGQPLNSMAEIKDGAAITADLTQEYWHKSVDADVRCISVSEATTRIVEKAAKTDLTLVEFFLTDKAGHERDPDNATAILQRLDDLLSELLNQFDFEKGTLVITSDHGNIEDLGTKSHTRNPVPLIVKGAGAERFENVESIMGVFGGMKG